MTFATMLVFHSTSRVYLAPSMFVHALIRVSVLGVALPTFSAFISVEVTNLHGEAWCCLSLHVRLAWGRNGVGGRSCFPFCFPLVFRLRCICRHRRYYSKTHQTYRTIHHTSNNANRCTKCKASVKGSSPSHVSIVLSTTQPGLRQQCYEKPTPL